MAEGGAIPASDPVVDALTQRLDRMERGLRRWRVFGVIAWAILAVSVALVFIAVFHVPGEVDTAENEESSEEQTVEDEVRARAFVLVDEEGRPRAALGMRPDGTPALAISSEDGRIIWKAP